MLFLSPIFTDEEAETQGLSYLIKQEGLGSQRLGLEFRLLTQQPYCVLCWLLVCPTEFSMIFAASSLVCTLPEGGP